MKVTRIEGTMTTADGQTRQFQITSEGTHQWGNTVEHLGHTVDPLEVIAAALAEDSHFTDDDETDDDEEG